MNRVSYDDVRSALERVGIAAGDNVIVHSSTMAFGFPDRGIATYLDPLLDAVGPSGTLAAPTFSFDFIRNGRFDFEETRSTGMGSLSEAIRKHPDALRTAHPLQSIALIGAKAEKLARVRTTSAYSPGSAFDMLTTEKFKILLLGAEPIHISLSHLCEERARVPYRFVKRVCGQARFASGDSAEDGCWDFFARHLDVPIFPEKEDVIVDELSTAGWWSETTLNGVSISAGGAMDFCDRLDEYLARDVYWMLPDPAPVKAFCESR